jgi:RarD protein
MKATKVNLKANAAGSLAMLIFSMFLFGTIGIFRRMIPLPSAVIACVRGLVGCLFLLLLVLVRKREWTKGITRASLTRLILTGILIGINWMLLFEAYDHTSVSIATLCYYLEPTFVVIIGSLLFREGITAKKMICAALSLIGMILISGLIESGLPSGRNETGIFMGIGAACFYSVVVLLNKSIRDVDVYGKTIIELGTAAAAMVVYLLFTGGIVEGKWSLTAVLLLLFVGIVHTGICYALYFGSLEKLQTQTIALFSYIDPVTALILSAVILHERLTVFGFIGAVLIIGSALFGELTS